MWGFFGFWSLNRQERHTYCYTPAGLHNVSHEPYSVNRLQSVNDPGVRSGLEDEPQKPHTQKGPQLGNGPRIFTVCCTDDDGTVQQQQQHHHYHTLTVQRNQRQPSPHTHTHTLNDVLKCLIVKVTLALTVTLETFLVVYQSLKNKKQPPQKKETHNTKV